MLPSGGGVTDGSRLYCKAVMAVARTERAAEVRMDI